MTADLLTDADPRTLLASARAAVARGDLVEACTAARSVWERQRSQPDAALADEAGHLLCMCLFRLGRLAELIETGGHLLPRLVPPSPPALRAELLRWLTLAASETGRHELALRCGNECFDLAQAHGGQKEISLAHTSLGLCFERMGDPWQAERLLGDALQIARDLADTYLLLVTLNNLCAVNIGAFYLLRGVGRDAEAEAQAALRRAERHASEAHALLPALDDPFFRVFIVGNLGEVKVHLGDLAEARRLLDAALALAQQKSFAAQGWRVRCSLGELLLAEGRHDEARAALASLLADTGGAAPEATLVRVHHGLYFAHRRLGQFEDALRHFELAEAIERERTVSQLKAQSELFVTRLEAGQMRREAERARQAAERERDLASAHAAEALRDPLTGLGNRRQLSLDLPGLLAAAAEQRQVLCAAMVDVDHFKQINDRHGHQVGDQVLVALAQLLRASTRHADRVVRLGGEEFLILLPDTEVPRALEVCDRLRQRVAAHPWAELGEGLEVTLSIGVVAAGTAPDSLLERADQVMYRAKAGGRNRVEAESDPVPAAPDRG